MRAFSREFICRAHHLTIGALALLLNGCFVASQQPQQAQQAAAPVPEAAVAPDEQLYRGLSADVQPQLAQAGAAKVGVRTLSFSVPYQINMSNQQRYARPLTLEVWYPTLDSVTGPKTRYEDETRTGKAFAIAAEAWRDAPLARSETKYPLVILSHGYTGYRSLMHYLGEHLASHGYVVAGIDHTDSTNADVDFVNAPFSGFMSTLYYRARDQRFSLDFLNSDASFVADAIDSNSAGLVGFSMGAYGTVNSIGGCFDFSLEAIAGITRVEDKASQKSIQDALNSCGGGGKNRGDVDPRWKAALISAPWGNQHGVFNRDDLAAIKVPALYVSGSLDDISDYDSIRQLFEDTGGKHKALLTLEKARHNIAGHPAPSAARSTEADLGHYLDATWDSERMNSIFRHFSLALFDCHLKRKDDACAFLQLEGRSEADNWKGFPKRFDTGLRWDSH